MNAAVTIAYPATADVLSVFDGWDWARTVTLPTVTAVGPSRTTFDSARGVLNRSGPCLSSATSKTSTASCCSRDDAPHAPLPCPTANGKPSRQRSRRCNQSRAFAGRQPILDSIPHIVWVAAPDGSTTYVNEYCVEYTGRPREANYHWGWTALVHPEDAERAERHWRDAVRDGTEFRTEYRIHRRDGRFRWHGFRARPLRGADGAIHTWVGSATDIHDEKRFEASLHKSEREAIEMLTLLDCVGRSGSGRVQARRPGFPCRPDQRPTGENKRHIRRVNTSAGRSPRSPRISGGSWNRSTEGVGGRVVRQPRPHRGQRRRSGTPASLAGQLLSCTRRRRGRRSGQRRLRRDGALRGRRVPRRGDGQHGRGAVRPRRRRFVDLHESGSVAHARLGRGRTARHERAHCHPLPTRGRRAAAGRRLRTARGPRRRPHDPQR